MMNEIILQDIRCFHQRQHVPLAPLTFLVGENSAGKSTFLATARLSAELHKFQDFDFNEEPFSLGTFDQIANYRGGKGLGTAKSFVMGYSVTLPDSILANPKLKSNRVEIIGHFKKGDPQPALFKWEFICQPYRVVIEEAQKGLVRKSREGSVKVFVGTEEHIVPKSLGFPMNPQVLSQIHFIKRYVAMLNKEKREVEDFNLDEDDATLINSLYDHAITAHTGKPFAFAPIRTTPRRTYDTLKETPTSTGDHVPNIIAKSYAKSEKNSVGGLKESIKMFGHLTGLFADLAVKRFGKKESDPFQIKVKVAGTPFNIVDVGYGVSQVLPIVVDISTYEDGKTFLLQQPEVHLHPKAQAGLGSFLINSVLKEGKQIVVETHSDFIIDRVRQEVRDKKELDPANVSILFFERKRNDVKIHHIGIDRLGNLVGVPNNYRKFFLDEEKKNLGI